MALSKVTWSATSIKQVSDALEYIRQDSVQNAENLYAKLIDKLETTAGVPESCPPDKYKINNDGSFRAFILSNYRVSFRVNKAGIKVLRFRHTKMEEKFY